MLRRLFKRKRRAVPSVGTAKATHEDAMRVWFVLDPEGRVLAVQPARPEETTIAFTRRSVDEKWLNMLCASTYMYQSINGHIVALQKLIELAEENGADAWAASLTELQNSLLLTQRMAIEGLDTVALSLIGEHQTPKRKG